MGYGKPMKKTKTKPKGSPLDKYKRGK